MISPLLVWIWAYSPSGRLLLSSFLQENKAVAKSNSSRKFFFIVQAYFLIGYGIFWFYWCRGFLLIGCCFFLKKYFFFESSFRYEIMQGYCTLQRLVGANLFVVA